MPRINDASATWFDDTSYVVSTGDEESRVITEDGRFVTALRGMRGDFNGGGEKAFIRQRAPGMLTELIADSVDRYVASYGQVFGLDSGMGISPVYLGAKSITTQYGRGRKKLAPIEDGFCYLTKVQGEFDGPAERVWLDTEGDHWYLNVRSACAEPLYNGLVCLGWKTVTGAATCYAYNQIP
jgi:hypothetical protein